MSCNEEQKWLLFVGLKFFLLIIVVYNLVISGQKRQFNCHFSFNCGLVVQAADKGNPRLSATNIVRIQVLDVNDNAPVVQPLGEVEAPENKCVKLNFVKARNSQIMI